MVSVVISVVSLAVYSSFTGGLRIWKRVTAPVEGEDTALFFERLGEDLRRVLPCEEAGFRGSGQRIEFPRVMYSRRMGKQTIGKVVYEFDRDSREIRRAAVDYSGMFTGEAPAFVTVLKEVDENVFSFYKYDREAKRPDWAQDWSSPALPEAVHVEIRRSNGGGETCARTFPIPAGGESG